MFVLSLLGFLVGAADYFHLHSSASCRFFSPSEGNVTNSFHHVCVHVTTVEMVVVVMCCVALLTALMDQMKHQRKQDKFSLTEAEIQPVGESH